MRSSLVLLVNLSGSVWSVATKIDSLDPLVTFTSDDEEESGDQDYSPFPRESPGKG